MTVDCADQFELPYDLSETLAHPCQWDGSGESCHNLLNPTRQDAGCNDIVSVWNLSETILSQFHNIMSDLYRPILGTYTHPDTFRRSRLLDTTYYFVRMHCARALTKEHGSMLIPLN